MVRFERVQGASYSFWPKTSLLALWQNWLLSRGLPRKKTLKKPDQNPGTLRPVKANDEKEAQVVSLTVRASVLDSAGDKPPTSPLSSAATTEESKVE